MSVLPTLQGYIGARRRWALRSEALQRFQQERGLATVRAAIRTCPAYRQHFQGFDRRHWLDLPVTDKQMLMENFRACNAAGIGADEAMAVALRAETSRDFRPALRGITVGLSSGTSGHRGIFLANPREQGLWAGAVLARVLREVPRGLRVAFCLRSFSRLYQAVESPLLRMRYFDIATEPDLMDAQLTHYDPQMLVAPPSLLRLLAERHAGGRLPIRPRRVLSVAEVLDPLDRALVERAFGVRVDQVYQCTEGFLAASCGHGSLHIQEDIVVVQEEPLPVEPGEGGQGTRRVVPIVTDLWRRTQPIIRYRLNDILHIADRPCACGCAFRVIERIEGRCDDMLVLRAAPGTGTAGEWCRIFPDTVRASLLAGTTAIRGYHVVQDAADHWTVTIDVAEGQSFAPVAAAAHAALVGRCANLGCRPPHIDVVAGKPTPRDARGKLRRVEQRWEGAASATPP